MADTNPSVKFGGDASGVKQGAKEGSDAVKGFADSVQGSIDQLKDFAQAIGAMWAIDKMEEFTRSVSDLGEQLERTAHMTGLSIDSIQNFQFAVQATGGDADTAQMSLLRMERNMALAAAQGGQMADAFARAGVSAKTLASGNVDQVLAEMADKFHATADGANKTEAAMQIAGRGGASLVPILDQGRDGLASLSSALDATGARLSPELAEKFAQTHQQITIFDTAARGASEAIFSKLEPGIDGAIVGLTRMDEQFTQNVKDGGAFGDIMEAAGKGMAAFVIGIDAIKTSLEGLWDAAKFVFEELGSALAMLGDEMVDVFSLRFGKAKNDFLNDVQEMKNIFDQHMTEMGQVGDQFGADFMRIMDAVNGKNVGFGTKGGKQGTSPFAPPPPKDDKSKDDFSQQRALIAEQYETKKEYDDLQVESGEMSHKQEFADLQRMLDQEQVAMDALYEAEMNQYEASSIEYKKLQEEKELADEKFNIQHMKLTAEAAKEDAKFWTQALDTIDKTFDEMVQGILQGTQTMGAVFQKMAQNLVISFTEAIAKMILQWGAFQALGPGSGIKNPFGGGGGGSASGEQNLMQQMITGLLSLVGVTTVQDTAVAANTAALAANTAALTVSAGAGAAGGGGSAAEDLLGALPALAMFDVGTPYVPHDMPAMIHEGEMIIPRGQSDKLRAGELSLGGGNHTHVHFNVSAMDGASVASWAKRNSSALSSAIAAGARGNHGELRAAMARM